MTLTSLETGTVFLRADAEKPASLVLRRDCVMSGWREVDNPGSMIETDTKDSDWTFFFLAGEMKATAFAFDRENAFAAGLKRLVEMAKKLRCNSVEISHVTHRLFFGFSKVSVSGHARHLKQGPLLVTG